MSRANAPWNEQIDDHGQFWTGPTIREVAVLMAMQGLCADPTANGLPGYVSSQALEVADATLRYMQQHPFEDQA